jgi:hypothetical protein
MLNPESRSKRGSLSLVVLNINKESGLGDWRVSMGIFLGRFPASSFATVIHHPSDPVDLKINRLRWSRTAAFPESSAVTLPQSPSQARNLANFGVLRTLILGDMVSGSRNTG